MKTVKAVVMSLDEAEGILQFQTGNYRVDLVPEKWCNFYACATDGRTLSAHETDRLFARYYGVPRCTHYMGDEGEIILLFDDQKEENA